MSKFLSFRKGEVKEIDEPLANQLISDGIAKEETLIEPKGTLNIIANGENIDVARYAKVNVMVPEPTGTIEIDQNRVYNVKNYEKANVLVSPSTSLVAVSFEGLAGFTYEDVKAVVQATGCVKITISGTMGNQPFYFENAYCTPNNTYDTTSGSSVISLAFAGNGQAGMFTIGFEFDDTDPGNPQHGVVLGYACMYMNDTWIDIRSMVTITVLRIDKVDGL